MLPSVIDTFQAFLWFGISLINIFSVVGTKKSYDKKFSVCLLMLSYVLSHDQFGVVRMVQRKNSDANK